MGPNGGRSSDFAGDKTMEAVQPPESGPGDCGLNAAADYALKFPLRAANFLLGLLLGGSQTFRFATNRPDWPQPLFSTVGAGERCDGAYQGSRLRLLCGQRRTHHATLPDSIAQMKAAANPTTQ